MTPCASPVTVAGFTHACGRCAPCVARKRSRAEAALRLECLTHPGRSWFSTLTYRTLPNGDGYADVQKWIKRFRKVGNSLRYCCVCERGRLNDRLHYHLLVFTEHSVRYRDIPIWGCGFSKHKLADGRACRYVSKYMYKQGTKVRRSSKFGVVAVSRVVNHPGVESVMNYFPGTRIKRVGDTWVPVGLLSAALAEKRKRNSEFIEKMMSASVPSELNEDNNDSPTNKLDLKVSGCSGDPEGHLAKAGCSNLSGVETEPKVEFPLAKRGTR